ncbi:MAG TPA: response regulator [Chthoniobacterales bacterium]|nr:response regulator [Chthoniobacterales bacterium]
MTVLFVEDHDDTRVALSGLLEHCGHEMVGARDTREALHLLASRRFDILLSDIGLPDGDGFQLVSRAKASQPHLKTIALTARATEADRQKAHEAGFDHFLAKPFGLPELRKTLAWFGSKSENTES